jgi:hypothetical protein
VGVIIAACAALELAVPLHLRGVAPPSPAYAVLRDQPPAPVIELPFFWKNSELHGHAAYMLASTEHWMPLVNGYSDYIPEDFREMAETLWTFPSAKAFKALDSRRPRYALFHMLVFGDRDRHDVTARIAAFSQYLRPLYVDQQTQLYEIHGVW